MKNIFDEIIKKFKQMTNKIKQFQTGRSNLAKF